MHDTPVLIVGGSLVGLSAALFLAWRGVPVTLVDKHTGSSPHPRAMGFTERTLEYFRAVGIDGQIPQWDPKAKLRRARFDSLSGEPLSEAPWTPGKAPEEKAHLSPVTGAAIPQDKLEPILREAARERGADLRLGVEMLSFHQDAGGITAEVRERTTGRTAMIRADYMIAADGADSPIREQLGIPRHGVGHLRTLRSVLFRCPGADEALRHGIQQFEIEQPGFKAFVTTYGDGRWVLMFDDDQVRSSEELRAAVLRALGRHLPFEIITTGRWEMAGRIAERYQDGRVFLVGDAAHQLPPTRGGFGANTGIDDAYNLAWKLQRVLNGRSDPILLDSYTPERQPVGWLRHQQTFARPDFTHWVGDILKDEHLYGDAAMELGQLIRSTVIVGAGSELPPAVHPDVWKGQPGSRAPHIWVELAGRQVSTIDLFTHGFVLLSADPRWCAAAEHLVDVRAYRVGRDVVFPEAEPFTGRFGVSPKGATLVRPDGVVCWRAQEMAADPTAVLTAAMHEVAAVPA
ncbi:FAD-dependent oxidoreductase [Methylobacterium sp. WL30]|uniref:FAD-dependent oxidoreductase n=1 Tax=unclassified Methylobacterium TaxID=2615210 RepID=UPI0011C79DD6|nr:MULTISPECIES: FAD-dependent oxidoreductase [unclassified Methylobacterium]TXN34496.1 FAD-dependent oxidoreductase [Methylobacterium sp. WL93]TXN49833.1 FAD-dependent oxidoreductase [Methylobacterium sp. WL119]TXN63684.1 FAD-dependent oxidoreductase [Methylobacterium sp. WL30]